MGWSHYVIIARQVYRFAAFHLAKLPNVLEIVGILQID